MVGALIIIAAVLAMLVWIIIPQLLEAFSVVVLGIQPMLEKLAAWIARQELPLPQIRQWVESLNLNWPELVQKAVSYLGSGVSNLLGSVVSLVSSVGGAVFQIVMALIFALYLLLGKDRLKVQAHTLARTYLPKKVRNRILYVCTTANDVFSRFIVGQCTEAVILGVLCTLGMLLFRFPYATMIGTLVGALALLPIVGAYLAAAIGAFYDSHRQPPQGSRLPDFPCDFAAGGGKPHLSAGGGLLGGAAGDLGPGSGDSGRRNRRHFWYASCRSHSCHNLPAGEAGRGTEGDVFRKYDETENLAGIGKIKLSKLPVII